MKNIFLLILVGILTGCGTYYVSPKNLANPANLTVTLASTDHSAHMTVQVFDSPSCKASAGYGLAANIGNGPFISNKPETIQVRPNEKIYLKITSSVTYAATGGFPRFTCSNLVSFTPKQDEAYTLSTKLLPYSGTCSTSIVNSQDKQTPPDFVHLKIPDNCKEKGLLDMLESRKK